MVRVGIAGIGFMGKTHYEAYRRLEGVRVAAIFTRDSRKLDGDWRAVRGNFGGAGGRVALTGIRAYRELDDLLGDGDLDLIDLCLPTHLHRSAAERALAAGKHVLVEKPLALNLEDADAMLAAAERAGRLLMVGQVLRFWPEFALLKAAADDGRYGSLLAAHFKRVISPPDWAPDEWLGDPKKSGGAVVDLHIHDSDFVQYLRGVPAAVSSAGVVGKGGQIAYLVTQYRYPEPGPCLTAQSGSLAQSAVPFEHGYDAYFERATLRYNSTTTPRVTAALADGGTEELEPEIEDAFVEELRVAVEAVAAGRLPPALAGRSARDSLAIVLAEAESVRAGREVAVAAR